MARACRLIALRFAIILTRVLTRVLSSSCTPIEQNHNMFSFILPTKHHIVVLYCADLRLTSNNFAVFSDFHTHACHSVSPCSQVTLLPSFPNESERERLKNCNDDLIEVLTESFEKNMDKFEIYCSRNVLDVPPLVSEYLASRPSAPTPTKSRKAARQSLSSTPSSSTPSSSDDPDLDYPEASEVPSKKQLTDLEAEVDALRATLRKIKRDKNALEKSLSETAASLLKTTTASVGLKSAVTECEAEAGGLGLIETVSAIACGGEGMAGMKTEGERLLQITGKAESGSDGREVKSGGNKGEEENVNLNISNNDQEETTTVAQKAGIKVKGGKAGIKGMMSILNA